MYRLNIYFRHVLIFISIYLNFCTPLLAQIDSRIALIIGNSNYKIGALKNPTNDATAMAKTLEQLGFEVMLKLDADRKEFNLAIREFDDRLRETNGTGLFYFAGHGLQYRGENYLLPVDARLERVYDLEDETIKMQQILRMMEYADNPMNIIILDACRNNPYHRNFRDLEQGLTIPKIAPKGSFIAYATAPGQVAADGKGDNGLYTYELLQALQKKGLPIEQVFKEVRNNVAKNSDDEQIPWENSSLIGEFIFNQGRDIKTQYELNNTANWGENPLEFINNSTQISLTDYDIRRIKPDPAKGTTVFKKLLDTIHHTNIELNSVAFYIENKGFLIRTMDERLYERRNYYYINLNSKQGFEGVEMGATYCNTIHWVEDMFIMTDCKHENPIYIQINAEGAKRISKYKYHDLLEKSSPTKRIKPEFDGLHTYYFKMEPYLFEYEGGKGNKLYKRKEP